jgi:hypothetical protein
LHLVIVSARLKRLSTPLTNLKFRLLPSFSLSSVLPAPPTDPVSLPATSFGFPLEVVPDLRDNHPIRRKNMYEIQVVVRCCPILPVCARNRPRHQRPSSPTPLSASGTDGLAYQGDHADRQQLSELFQPNITYDHWRSVLIVTGAGYG